MTAHIQLVNAADFAIILSAGLASIEIGVQDLLDRDFAEDLQVHQWQEIGLIVLVLRYLSVVID